MNGLVTWEVLGWIAGLVITSLIMAGSIAGWVLTRLEVRDQRIKKLEDSLSAHKLHAAETFATKVGLTESLERVHTSLDRLAERIDALMREVGARVRGGHDRPGD